MSDALWDSDDTLNEAELLFHDPTQYAWQHREPVQWHIVWYASIGLIR